MIRGLRLLYLMSCCLAGAACLAAADRAVLRCAVFDAPPFIILPADPRAEPTGIDIDVARELARRLDLRPVFVKANWARCLSLLRSGQADLLSSVYRNPERETFLHYLGPPYLDQLPIAFYYRAGSGISIRSYEDIRRYSPVGVLQDASYFPRFDQDTQLVKETISTQEQLLPMLDRGRIPVAACYVDTQNYYLKVLGYSGRLVRSEFIWNARAEVFVVLGLKSPLARRQADFDRVWQAMTNEGFVRDTVAKYRALYP